ncbi:MAG: NUDIX domain-containing protein, partial [Pseudomonadota bacterium]
SDWVDVSEDRPAGTPPIQAEWQAVAGEVRHTFTHFHLILTVMHGDVARGTEPTRGAFYERAQFRPSDLPTVMRKAYDLTHT